MFGRARRSIHARRTGSRGDRAAGPPPPSPPSWRVLGWVHIPASYCGLFGIRPTYGAVSLAGVCPLAPSFDTCGWFSRNASVLAGVGEVLLPGGKQGVEGPLLRVEEAWVNAQPDVAEALRPALEKLEQLRGRSGGGRL